jgi:hypothetical protein
MNDVRNIKKESRLVPKRAESRTDNGVNQTLADTFFLAAIIIRTKTIMSITMSLLKLSSIVRDLQNPAKSCAVKY